MRRFNKIRCCDWEISIMTPPQRINMRTSITHRRRKMLGNERSIGVVLYRGTITRKGVRALELVDVNQ